MSDNPLNWIANFVWGIADDVLRDVYVRGKYRDVIPSPQPAVWRTSRERTLVGLSAA